MSSLTYNDMLGAYENYPAPICPYLLRAETHPFLRSLFTKKTMRVFIDVIARAPIKDPLRPILLSVQNTEEKLGISTRTISRTLNALRDRGWLKRLTGTDGRDNWGQFNAGQFVLGEELRSMLGFPISTESNVRETPLDRTLDSTDSDCPEVQQGQDSEEANEDSDAPEYASDVGSCVDTEQAGEEPAPVDNCASEEEKTTVNEDNGQNWPTATNRVNKVFKKEASFENEASQRKTKNQAKQPKIPKDLIQLQTDLGIHPFGICKLMTLAKAANQRLQDVWIAKRDQILNAGARQGRAVKYFEFLIGCGEDFSYVAQQKLMGKASKSAPQMPESKILDVRLYWNKKFIGEGGVRVQIHGDGSGEITDMRRSNTYIMPADMGQIYQAIASSKLKLMED